MGFRPMECGDALKILLVCKEVVDLRIAVLHPGNESIVNVERDVASVCLRIRVLLFNGEDLTHQRVVDQWKHQGRGRDDIVDFPVHWG